MRIGLIIGVFDSSYCLSIYKWISQEVKARKASLIVLEGHSFDNNSPDNVTSNTLFRIVHRERLDGLIILSSSINFSCGNELVEKFAHTVDLPVVSIGVDYAGVPSIALNNAEGFKKIVSHLIDVHNYSKFAHIGGPLSHPESLDRQNAFLEIIQQKGLSLRQEFTLEGSFGYMSGYNHAKTLLEPIKRREIDAVVCANDEMALAAIRCFNDNGIRVPEDVAVSGFDGTGLLDYCSPLITTVNQRFDLIAKKAVSALFELICCHQNTKTYLVDPELLVRESCGCKLEDALKKEAPFPYISSYRLNGRLQLLSAEELNRELTSYLKENNISHCFIVCYPEALPFDDTQSLSNIKGTIFYGYSRGKLISYPKPFLFSDILPDQFLEDMQEAVLIKPLFFSKHQFGFLLISAYEAMAPFIDDLGLELCHYMGSQYQAREQKEIEKRLLDAHESLKISNKRLNELTVKENLDKLTHLRFLAANMLQHRRSSTGDYVLILVEIDNFYDINSKYGFDEGEFTLSKVSQILSNSIRDDDFLSHQSCERYVIMVKNIQNDPIKTIGNRFIKGLNELNTTIDKPYAISFSWGSALGNVDNDFDAIYHKAEQNLLEYKQKKYKVI